MKVIGSGPSDKVRNIAERVNETSNADFVRRLLDERRKVLLNPDGSVSTHELGYRDDGKGNAVVYPLVQSVNGGNAIHRFDDDMAYDRALYNRDTLLMSTPEAKAFTEGYKEVYPGFDQYAPVPGMAVGSRYMPQWSPEINLLGPYFEGDPVVSVPAEPDLFSEEALERRALKQRYAESGFRDNAVSGAGAQGAWQIMPITYQDYLGRGKGKKGDLNDPVYNRKVRDWVMEIIPKSLGEFYSEDDDPRVRLAKIYGAYNWGAGNMRKYLRKQKEKGVDIAKDTSWVEGLNPETKRYIKYLALDEDFEGSPYTTEKFEAASRKRGFMDEDGNILRDGGRMFEMGGPSGPAAPVAVLAKYVQDLIEKYKVAATTANKAIAFFSGQAGNDGKIYLGELMDAFEVLPESMKKRAIEVAMRATHNADPYSALQNYYNATKNKSANPLDDVKYIITGYGSPSLNINDGLYHKRFSDAKTENDVIDAVVYGRQLNPNIGVQVTDGDFGILQDYKDRVYPDRNIQFVQTSPSGISTSQEDIKSMGVIHPSAENYFNSSFKTSDPHVDIDNAGYSMEYGNRNDSTFVRAWDIYDFASPADDSAGYKSRWGIDRYDSQDKAVDAIQSMITPLFIRTPWVYYKDASKIVNDDAVQYGIANNINARANGGLLKFFDGGGDTEEYGIPYYSQNTGAMYPGMSYSDYLYTVPEVAGGSIDPAVVTTSLPAKFNGSQEAARRYAEGYQKGAKPVSEAMNRAGQDIYKVADTVAGFVPGPIGAINWLGHMGADVANGEYGKVAKDVALAAAMGLGLGAVSKGIGYLKNSWDDAFNFGEDVFRAFTDSAPASASHVVPVTNTAAKVVPAVSKAVSAPYEIETLGGGYMLKSLMRGNPLEKQISKNGTVNVNNINALVKKGSKVEQAVVNKVLASEEFAGKKSIDYNKFRKAVQDELITYDRVPDTRWADYGVSRLGLSQSEDLSHLRNIEDYARSDRFEVVSTDTIGQARLWRDKVTGDILNWDGITQRYLGEHDVLNAGPGLNTFTFSSSRIPDGSSKHYNSNTLGHSRTYTTADEPDILHVMESQSDWGQGYERELKGYNSRIAKLNERIAQYEEDLKNGVDIYGEELGDRVNDWIKQLEQDRGQLGQVIKWREKFLNRPDVQQQDYLAENFTSRQIQENLRYAAEKGQTKMRYPTKETAAKIEGYPKETNYYDADGNLVTDRRRIYTIGKENEKELDLIQRELDGYYAKFNVARLPNGDYVPAGSYSDNPYQQLIEAIPRRQAAYDGWRTRHPNATSEKGQRIVDEMKQRAEEIKNFRLRVKYLNQRMKELKSIKPYVDPSIKKEVKYMHEDDILRKYNEFPKQFKKLYKGADVRTVTDPKGNTWYEVDVPEDYLQQEWAFAEGGSLILPKMMMDKYHPDKIRQAIAKIRAGK